MPGPPPGAESSSPIDAVLWLLPLAVTTIHAVMSPLTKVEESFTLHALHDLIYRGFRPSSEWDHVEFPGPLPRSFIPAILLSLVVKPVLWLAQHAVQFLAIVSRQEAAADGPELDKFLVQILARVILGLLSSASLLYVGRQVRLRHGSTAQRLYLLLSVTQFHIMYYASRTLPNFMALPFVNVAFGLVLSSGQAGSPRGSRAKRDGLALAILAATATIIRSELACLLAPLALALLAKRRLSLTQTIGWGALGGLGGTALTIAVDSAFWGHLTWPEAYGVWFNVVRNESAKQWGTSPWSYYLKHLPLLLLAAAPLALLAGLVRPVRRRLDWTIGILPAAIMVGAMSALGHKEWRFVAYVVPWLNVPAAVMAARLWQPASSPSALRLLSRTLVLGALAANAMAAGGLLWISVGNYPGGDIMRGPMRDELRRFGGRPVHLYSPSLPLQTGSTLFLADSREEPGRSWTFNKTEFADPLTPELASAQIAWTHVVLPSGSDDEVALWTAESASADRPSGWDEVGRASGFGGFNLRLGPSEAVGHPRGPWAVFNAASGIGAGWGTFGGNVQVREGERCVLVRRRGLLYT